MYNIMICGAAGDGVETMSAVLERLLKRSGVYIFTIKDAMSRVRGGQNFVQIRFSNTQVMAHRDALDCMFFTNDEAFELHKNKLKKDGIAICDASLKSVDSRIIKLDLIDTAKNLGNARAFGSVGLGAILKLFGATMDAASEVLKKSMKDSILEVNLFALQSGYKMVDGKYDVKVSNTDNHIVTNANHALAIGALSAGVKFYSAYPMSPSTTILEYMEEHGNRLGVDAEQAEDEIAAINMALGASYAGVRSMVGTSGGGFSLMVEALGFAGIAEIPIVMVDVQRPGPATGLPTRTEQSDLKFMVSASQGEFPRMVIALKHHEDAFYQGARAVELAYKYRIPVIVLSDQYLGDASATIPILDVNQVYKADEIVGDMDTDKSYLYTDSGVSPARIPGKSKHPVRADSDEHDEYGLITESAEVRNEMMEKRMKKLDLLSAELIEPEFIGNEDCETLIIGFGSTYGAIKEAIELLNDEGNKQYGALLFGDVWPLPTQRLKKYAKQAKQIINIEQNATGQLASIVREVALIACDKSILKYDGR